jgi:hypothetical protein
MVEQSQANLDKKGQSPVTEDDKRKLYMSHNSKTVNLNEALELEELERAYQTQAH